MKTVYIRVNTCYNINERCWETMKYSELKKILKSNGCRIDHSGGRHEIWYSPITGKTFPVGRHQSEDVAKGTLKAILKQAGIE